MANLFVVANQPQSRQQASDAWTVKRILDWTTQHLRKKGSDSPRLDTEILLAHARGCSRIELYTRFDEVLSAEERRVMRALVERRARAEPVAYLVGHREFFGLPFNVSPDVLIPRPDTETLVVELLDVLKQRPRARVLDVGTGSGCIAVCAAVHGPQTQVTAIDISPAALQVAQGNAQQHAVGDQIAFLHGDLFDPLEDGVVFDVVVSNPPYVRTDELSGLPPDVAQYEPPLALVAGPDGLDVIRRLVPQAAERLVPGGQCILEIAVDMAEAVVDLLEQTRCFPAIAVVNDLSGQPRVISACRGTP